MNQRYAGSAYFSKESDARRAAEDLRARGYDVDVHSEGSHGQSFWESIKNFFKGEPADYSTGVLLMVAQGDPEIVRTVVQQYNGRMSDTGSIEIERTVPRATPVGTADIGMTTRPPAGATMGETDTDYGTNVDEVERDRMRSSERGGIDNTGL